MGGANRGKMEPGHLTMLRQHQPSGGLEALQDAGPWVISAGEFLDGLRVVHNHLRRGGLLLILEMAERLRG